MRKPKKVIKKSQSCNTKLKNLRNKQKCCKILKILLRMKFNQQKFRNNMKKKSEKELWIEKKSCIYKSN